jgi:NUMOD4 motif
MTTHRDIGQIAPYWFGRTAQEVSDAVNDRAEQWAPVPGYSRYLWSDKGRVRISVNGRIMRTRVSNSGYELVNVVRDGDGRQVTVTVHSMVLLAHHPAFRGLAAFPDGLETRHNPATGPLFNAYPEGLWPGTKEQNAADKAPQDPQFECRNFAACGNMVHNQGRRCVPCTEAVGRAAAVMLDAGANLMTVAERFGYSGPDWVHKLAVKYGGYAGTKAAALAQHPGVGQRIRLRAITRRCDAL